MGIVRGMLGHASQIDVQKLENEFKEIITINEQIELAYKLVRDLYVFTNKRLILVDKQGITGKKVEYHSIPYKSISHFAVETAGHFDLDSELKIWISGNIEPIEKEFKKDSSIKAIQKTLAMYVLNFESEEAVQVVTSINESTELEKEESTDENLLELKGETWICTCGTENIIDLNNCTSCKKFKVKKSAWS